MEAAAAAAVEAAAEAAVEAAAEAEAAVEAAAEAAVEAAVEAGSVGVGRRAAATSALPHGSAAVTAPPPTDHSSSPGA